MLKEDTYISRIRSTREFDFFEILETNSCHSNFNNCLRWRNLLFPVHLHLSFLFGIYIWYSQTLNSWEITYKLSLQLLQQKYWKWNLFRIRKVKRPHYQALSNDLLGTGSLTLILILMFDTFLTVSMVTCGSSPELLNFNQ